MPADDDGARGSAVLAALERASLGRLLTELAAERAGVHAVGGFVRDVLLGRRAREIDVVVQGDAQALAHELARRSGGMCTGHGRFGTATVRRADERVDLAATRTESYPARGALPAVTLGVELERDLQRRDFTVNAIAVGLGGAERGRLRAAPMSVEDLRGGRLRVLHDASFQDDPTRLLRLSRYAQRLNFEVEAHTALLVEQARAARALDTVSRPRVGAELRLLLEESDPLAALTRAGDMGLLAAIDPRLALDARLAGRALELLPRGERVPPLLLAACTGGFASAPELREWLDALDFSGRERDTVLAAALGGDALARHLAQARRPSQVRAAAAGHSPQAVALAGARGPGEAARRWLEELRHAGLEITGEDLLAAGVTPGPEVGRRLELALALRLDGELAPGAQAELHAALAD